MKAHLARNKARYIVYFTAQSFIEANGTAYFDHLWNNSLKTIFYRYSWTNKIWPEVWGGNAKKISIQNITDGLEYRASKLNNKDELALVLDEFEEDNEEIDCEQFFNEVLQSLVNNAATQAWCNVFQPKLTILSSELAMVPPSVRLSSSDKKKLSNATGIDVADERLLDESLNEAYKIPLVQQEVQRLI